LCASSDVETGFNYPLFKKKQEEELSGVIKNKELEHPCSGAEAIC
jgi:hypothetical protein